MIPLFNVITSFSYTVLIIIILASFFISLYFYRKTIPNINTTSKILLLILRFLTISVIFLAIGELTLEHIKILVNESRTAILVDNSKSVDMYKENVVSALEKIFNNLKSKNVNYDVFVFNNKIYEFHPDSLDDLKFNGYSTDISQALNKILKEKEVKNYQNIILVTDGIYNLGEKPTYTVEKLGIPIFSIGVGDPSPKNDISVDNIISNDLIYAQNQATIRVNIKSSGFEGKTTSISLFEDNNLLEKKLITLGSDFQEIEFTYTPETEGERKLNVKITPLEKEFTVKNNSASKYVKVLSNKIRVLTIAGKPSSDLSFINQAIKTNTDFRLETLIERSPNEFYPLFSKISFIDSADVIFLIGFPTQQNSESLIRKILNRIEKDNIPLFILLNPDVDFNRLNAFKSYLPFDWRSAYGTATQVLIDVNEEKSKSEILSIDRINSLEIWNSFPPIFRVDREFIAKPESEILAYYRLQNNRINQPLILSRNLNRHRSIAFLGFNIWRLKLLTGQKEVYENYFDRLINNIIKWLTTQEITKRFSVNLQKKIYDINEKVTFIAQFYDEANNPINDAEIFLNVSSPDKKLTTQFKPLGNGIYSVELSNLEEGDYEFNANVHYASKKFQNKGKFTISESELEFRDLTLKEDLLIQMSLATNGSYFHLENADNFIDNINKNLKSVKKEQEITSVFYAWNSFYVLIALITFLSIEWYLRKKWGLL